MNYMFYEDVLNQTINRHFLFVALAFHKPVLDSFNYHFRAFILTPHNSNVDNLRNIDKFAPWKKSWEHKVSNPGLLGVERVVQPFCHGGILPRFF